MSKAILLLGTLSFCWQSSALAIEEESREGGMKRLASQVEVFDKEKECYFKGLLNDTISYLLEFFDLRKDQNALLAFMASCKTFHSFIMQRYSEANKDEHHYPWRDNLSLKPSVVYILNTRLQTILGFYHNLKIDMTNSIDQIWFEKLCFQFLEKNSLFSKTFIPVKYVKLLQLDQQSRQGFNLFQAPFSDDLEKVLKRKKQNCIFELSTIATQLNLLRNNEGQNEAALYFHCSQFAFDISPFELAALKNTPLFKTLNGSLMRVMDAELLSLKATPGLSLSGDFAETWERIIDLESTATIYQPELWINPIQINITKHQQVMSLRIGMTQQRIWINQPFSKFLRIPYGLGCPFDKINNFRSGY